MGEPNRRGPAWIEGCSFVEAWWASWAADEAEAFVLSCEVCPDSSNWLTKQVKLSVEHTRRGVCGSRGVIPPFTSILESLVPAQLKEEFRSSGFQREAGRAIWFDC